VKLIPAQFVKPFVKSNKNDFLDAEAIAEAVDRQNMRFVPIKSAEQLDLQALHRIRSRLVGHRTAAALGAAAGLLYAAGDVATKAAVGGGARFAFVPALLACHGLAFVALQLGFQRGTALATAGVATLLTNALPIVAGTALFHEGLPDGALGALRVLAFVAVVAGAAGLARAEPAAVPDNALGQAA